MKKRVLSLLTALLLVLSAFILAGCPAEEPEKPLTPKELFSASLSNAFTGNGASSNIMAGFDGSKDTVANMKLELTEFSANGQDITSLGAINADFTVSADVEKQLTSMDGSLSLFGETIPLSAVVDVNNNRVFITNLLGVYDKAILFPVETDIDEEMMENEEFSQLLDYINSGSAEAVGNHVIATVQKVISANIDDSVYTLETKDVTVEGQDFKGAQVIRLTLTGERIKTIGTSFIDELLKNEDVKKLFGDEFDYAEITDEIKDAADEIASIVISNTVVDNKTVALDIVATESETDDDDDDDDDTIDTFAAKFSKVGANFTFNIGYMDENGFVAEKGYYTVKNSGSNGNYEFYVKFTEGNESKTLVSVKTEGTLSDNKFDGTVTGTIKDNTFSVKIVAEKGENSGKIAISNIKLKSESVDTELPLKLSLVYAVEENKISYGGDIEFSVEEQMVSVKAKMDCTVELKDVTIEAVTDYVKAEDVDGEALTSALMEKYPTIMSMLESMGGSEGGSAPEFEYDEQYFEEDGFGIWLPEGFKEVDIEGYDAAFESDEVGIFALEQEYEDLPGIDTLMDYADAVYENTGGDNLSYLYTLDDEMPFFEYTYDVDGATYNYLVAMWDGSDGYWMIIFGCEEGLYDYYRDYFIDWAWYCDTYA